MNRWTTGSTVATLAVGIAFGAILFFPLKFGDRWRVEPIRVEKPASAGDDTLRYGTDHLCASALVSLPGARTTMTASELHGLLSRQFDVTAVGQLQEAHAAGRMIIGQDAIFFPTKDLCDRADLSGQCRALCAAYSRSRH